MYRKCARKEVGQMKLECKECGEPCEVTFYRGNDEQDCVCEDCYLEYLISLHIKEVYNEEH